MTDLYVFKIFPFVFSCSDKKYLFFFDLVQCGTMGPAVFFQGCPTPQVRPHHFFSSVFILNVYPFYIILYWYMSFSYCRFIVLYSFSFSLFSLVHSSKHLNTTQSLIKSKKNYILICFKY